MRNFIIVLLVAMSVSPALAYYRYGMRGIGPVHVRPYVRSNGRFVMGYNRSLPYRGLTRRHRFW